MMCCFPGCGEPGFTMLAGYALCRDDWELTLAEYCSVQHLLSLSEHLQGELLAEAMEREFWQSNVEREIGEP